MVSNVCDPVDGNEPVRIANSTATSHCTATWSCGSAASSRSRSANRASAYESSSASWSSVTTQALMLASGVGYWTW